MFMQKLYGFSPRNGEIILKLGDIMFMQKLYGFSPRNGEIILKECANMLKAVDSCFSPRNGEIILKRMGFTAFVGNLLFQSPQWGDNSKVC